MSKGKVMSTDQKYVKRGFGAGEYLGLPPVQQAAAMGERILYKRNLQGLKARLGRKTSPDNRARADYLVEIVSALRILYKKRILIRVWMEEPQHLLGGKTPRELITSVHLSNMERVAHLLDRLTHADDDRQAAE